ncbi:MAG: hypothetical protein IJV39_05055 [Ruminococcus sp.]|nr:hypothetical protein [Ruminococcus sp.]
MKKLISLIIAVTVLAMSALHGFSATSAEKEKLLLLGDSIAYGYGLTSDNEKYGNIIANDYNFELINDAVVGDATSDLLKLIKTNTAVQNDIQSAQTIVISIGGNDFLGLRKNATLTDLTDIISKGEKSTVLVNMLKNVKTNLAEIHKKLRELNGAAKIILQTVYNPFQGRSDTFTNMLCDIVNLIRKDFTKYYFDEVKDDEDMVIADIESLFRNYYTDKNYNGTEIVQSDYVHPTAKGHQMIADEIEPAIDLVHRARWTTLSRSANCLIRLTKQINENSDTEVTNPTE